MAIGTLILYLRKSDKLSLIGSRSDSQISVCDIHLRDGDCLSMVPSEHDTFARFQSRLIGLISHTRTTSIIVPFILVVMMTNLQSEW
jgi:hypothetical protein